MLENISSLKLFTFVILWNETKNIENLENEKYEFKNNLQIPKFDNFQEFQRILITKRSILIVLSNQREIWF